MLTGASFALMGGFLGGAAPADNLKTLMPDMQQFWTPHSDGQYDCSSLWWDCAVKDRFCVDCA